MKTKMNFLTTILRIAILTFILTNCITEYGQAQGTCTTAVTLTPTYLDTTFLYYNQSNEIWFKKSFHETCLLTDRK